MKAVLLATVLAVATWPAQAVDGQTIGSFVSSVSGTFSASSVPEPAGLAPLGIGLLALAGIKRRT